MVKDPKDPAQPVVDDEVVDPGEEIELPDEGKPADKQVVDLDAVEEDEKAFSKLDNAAFAAMRKEAADAKKQKAELEKRVKEYEAQLAAPKPVAAPEPVGRREMIGGVPVPQTKAEWDALARQDWQTAVDLRSIIKSREVQAETRKVETYTKTMEEAKQRVLDRHPELADATTEKGRIYLEILEKNPEYLTMAKGPVLAMRDMEDEMEARGFSQDQIHITKRVLTQNEAARVSRGALTGAGRMPEKTSRTVTLSKDDLEFCKTQGLDPKEYAKEKLENEARMKGAQL